MLGRMPRRPRRPVASAPRRPVARAALAAVLASTALLGTGCGGSAGSQEPTGVDGLRIPTPSPDPGDFVATIDNRWLPLAPGARWTYDVTGTAPGRSATVSVLDEGATVAGVAVTLVRTDVRDSDGRRVRSQVAALAQDRAGNVWLLAQTTTVWGDGGPATTEWAAGEESARAGLAMATSPRLGDGYLLQDAPGVARDRARVDAVDAAQVTDQGTFEHLLLLVVTSPLPEAAAASAREWYAAGTGLVVADRVTPAGSEHWVLTSGPAAS